MVEHVTHAKTLTCSRTRMWTLVLSSLDPLKSLMNKECAHLTPSTVLLSAVTTVTTRTNIPVIKVFWIIWDLVGSRKEESRTHTNLKSSALPSKTKPTERFLDSVKTMERITSLDLSLLTTTRALTTPSLHPVQFTLTPTKRPSQEDPPTTVLLLLKTRNYMENQLKNMESLDKSVMAHLCLLRLTGRTLTLIPTTKLALQNAKI